MKQIMFLLAILVAVVYFSLPSSPEPVTNDEDPKLLFMMRAYETVYLENKKLQAKLDKSEVYKIHHAKITAYTLTEEQCGSDLAHNALMLKPQIGDVAVSRDWAWMLGSKIKISGIGIYTVNDLMAEGITKSVDIYMGEGKSSYNKAIDFGVKYKNIVVITK